jgi:hypothetical protein
MNAKRKIYLVESLRKLENNTFDENDIRLLLIEIRDLLKKESFLREVCNFIAHPERDKGICHARINSRHAKMKFYKESSQKLKDAGVFEQNLDKPWEFFSEQLLAYIETPRIEKQLFEILIKEGIEEIPEELFLEYYKLPKAKLKEFVLKAYNIKNGFYILSPIIKGKSYLFIDDLLKFIRGTITGTSAFNQTDIENDFKQGIKRIIINEKIEIDFKRIENSLESIVVCIISILHEADFTLFDKSIAKSYVTVGRETSKKDDQILYLSLYAETDNLSFPVISTSILATKYIKATNEEIGEFELKPMPWIIANRNNENILELRKNWA